MSRRTSDKVIDWFTTIVAIASIIISVIRLSTTIKL